MTVAVWWHSGTAESQAISDATSTGQLNITLEDLLLSSDGNVIISCDFSGIIGLSLSAQGSVAVPSAGILDLVLDSIQLSASASSQVRFLINQQNMDFDIIKNYDYDPRDSIYNNDVPNIMNSKPDKLVG